MLNPVSMLSFALSAIRGLPSDILEDGYARTCSILLSLHTLNVTLLGAAFEEGGYDAYAKVLI